MQNLTSAGQQVVNDLSGRYNLSQDAVMHMLVAVNNGAGTMAQFNCPELGGGGQWMSGGMTMVGDMFNYSLKNTVNNLCAELANALANSVVFNPVTTQGGNNPNWWPSDLGQPFSSGGQNNSRYALFPNRLAVEVNGILSIYDTLDHNIGGVSQQQGSNDSLVFNSQYGTISVSSLPIVPHLAPSATEIPALDNQNFMQQPEPVFQPPLAPTDQAPQTQNTTSGNNSGDIIQLIEKLAHLRDVGALTEDEYQNKKNDLLSRI